VSYRRVEWDSVVMRGQVRIRQSITHCQSFVVNCQPVKHSLHVACQSHDTLANIAHQSISSSVSRSTDRHCSQYTIDSFVITATKWLIFYNVRAKLPALKAYIILHKLRGSSPQRAGIRDWGTDNARPDNDHAVEGFRYRADTDIHRVKWRQSNLWSLCCGATRRTV